MPRFFSLLLVISFSILGIFLNISKQTEIKHIISYFGILISIIGYLYKVEKEKSDKAFLLFSLRKEFIENKIIRKVFYQIEYNNFPKVDLNDQKEKDIDQFLCYLDNIAYLSLTGKLTKEDMEPYSYYLKRTLTNENVLEYIDWVDIKWAKETLKYEHSPISYLVKFKIRNKV